MTDMTAAERYISLVADLVNYPDVTFGGNKGFGSSALKVHGKVFAMLASGEKFVIKLPRQRVEALIAAGDGERFDANHGRWMKEWVTIKVTAASQWLDLAKEAMKFVGSKLT